MKTYIAIITAILFIFANNPVYAWAEINDSKQQYEYNLTTESIELGSTLATGGLALYIRANREPWTQSPLIGGATNLEFKPATVPSIYLYAGAFATLLSIVLLPNNLGWLNDITYINSKGFAQAFAINALLTVIAKRIFGRKRPDYGARIANKELSKSEVLDGSASFFSGHASISFNMATYFSLFIWEHIGNKDNSLHLTGKIIISTLLMTLAGWVAYTRVADHKHHIEDIVVGSLVGISTAVPVYGYQNGWFGNRYQKANAKQNLTTQSLNQNINLLSHSWTF